MEKKRYQAILFDLDGTLIDNYASFWQAFDGFAAEFPNVFRTEDEVQRATWIDVYYRSNRKSAYQAFCKRYGWQDAPEFDEVWKLWFSHYVRHAKPFPWTVDLLTHLQEKQIAIGILTNGSSEYQWEKLRSSSLNRYFEHVLVSEEIGIAKPSPEPYRLIAELLDVSVGDCLFVGDTPHTDILGAKNAGMDSLLVSGKSDPIGATYHANDITFVMELI